MTFVTVSDNREQLAMLSRYLVAIFPGCTIYQSCDPIRAIHPLSDRKVDVVFADLDTVSNMMHLLGRQKTRAKIWLLCQEGAALPEETAVCYGVLSCPITEQKIRNALESVCQSV